MSDNGVEVYMIELQERLDGLNSESYYKIYMKEIDGITMGYFSVPRTIRCLRRL